MTLAHTQKKLISECWPSMQWDYWSREFKQNLVWSCWVSDSSNTFNKSSILLRCLNLGANIVKAWDVDWENSTERWQSEELGWGIEKSQVHGIAGWAKKIERGGSRRGDIKTPDLTNKNTVQASWILQCVIHFFSGSNTVSNYKKKLRMTKNLKRWLIGFC